MSKKEYMKPAMQVVKILHTGILMTSGLNSSRSNYGSANSGVDPNEQNSEGQWEWN